MSVSGVEKFRAAGIKHAPKGRGADRAPCHIGGDAGGAHARTRPAAFGSRDLYSRRPASAHDRLCRPSTRSPKP